MVTDMNTPHTEVTDFPLEPLPCTTTEAEIARRFNITAGEMVTLDENIRRTVHDWVRRNGLIVDPEWITINIRCANVEETINFPDATEFLQWGVLSEHVHPDADVSFRSRHTSGTPLIVERGEILRSKFTLSLQQRADVHA